MQRVSEIAKWGAYGGTSKGERFRCTGCGREIVTFTENNEKYKECLRCRIQKIKAK